MLLGGFLRGYKLGTVPHGFFIDEASEGYSAYSILKTGKDEHGKPFPIVFKSLGDFKTPTYIYLIVPFIPILGLTPFTVRFPSFLFSLLTIPIVYLLIMEIDDKKKPERLALISAFLLAISPWSIVFARSATESTVALFLLLSGVLTFFKSLKRPVFLIASMVLFALALPAYHAERILSPLIFLILVYKYKNIIFAKTYKKYLYVGIFLSALISIPTVSIATTPGFLVRAMEINIFSGTHIDPGTTSATRMFISNYLSYWSPKSMFAAGDPDPGNSLPNQSTFFFWQAPFYLIGIFVLIKKGVREKLKFIVFVTLFISPIPAALVVDYYSTIRSLPILIPQIILMAIGVDVIYIYLKNGKLRIIYILVLIALSVYSVAKLYTSIFTLNEMDRAKYWDYGWQELAQELPRLKPTLPTIVESNRQVDYYELLFFWKFDPDRFQRENHEIPINQYYTNLGPTADKHLNNVYMRQIDWEKDTKIDQYLVGNPQTITPEKIGTYKLIVISEIYYPNGEVAFRIVRTTKRL